MRKIFIPAAAIAALAFAGCGSDDDNGGSSGGGGYGSAAPATTETQETTPAESPTAVKDAVTVNISNFKFAPPAVAVSKGGTVTWTNDDSAPHTATDNKSKTPFDTGTLNKGDSKKITFSEPGTFAYICDFHPFMKGTVTVQ